MASLYVRSEGNGGNTNGTSSTDGAGGLIGSASGTTKIENSYSGGRTTNANGTPAYKDEAGQPDAAVSDTGYPQGRYNVYLAGGNGAAGGLVGKATGTLTITNAYSTSSVAAASDSAYAGGLVGDADSLKAGNTYCTGRVYLKGAATAASNNADQENTENGAQSADGNAKTDSTQKADTKHFGYYAGRLGSLSKEGDTNYYLKGMNGAPEEAVGTVGNTKDAESKQDTTIPESTLTGADFYASDCPLKKGVDTKQKTYYYDASAAGESAHYADDATRYPFLTFTTAFARFYYHPVTGAKIEAAAQDSAKYAQIGDWEVPEETVEATFGLIYYEKIWDGTKTPAQLDTTFYYHGYMLQSGENAKTATYTEISSSKAFVTEKEHYVSESGYLLLVKEGEEKERYVCLAKNSSSVEQPDILFKQRIKEETDEENGLKEYKLDTTANPALAGYKAYHVNFSSSIFSDRLELLTPNENFFGALLCICEYENNGLKATKAAFTYVPFFYDALKPAEKGVVQTVSKAVASDTNSPQAIIRGADQLKYFFTYENEAPNTGFLDKEECRIIEQQLDITFDSSKVRFTKNGEIITATDEYQPPTLSKISKNATYRSKLRPNPASDSDYYVLDGLRGELVTTVYGELCDLQVTNMKASHFLDTISGDAANVHDITITNAQFGKGDDYESSTDAGFAAKMTGKGEVSDCKIINASIYGTGFINNTADGNSGGGTITRCYIVNATIWGDGFITSNGANIEDCGIYANTSLYEDSIYFRPMQANPETYDYVSIGIAPGGSKSASSVAGFVQKQTMSSSIKNCWVAGKVYGSGDVAGFIGEVSGESTIEACYANVVINAGGNASGFAAKLNGNNTNAKIVNCHALGKIEGAKTASGFVQTIEKGTVSNCYEAFWSVDAKSWYPFYESYTNGAIETNYYLTDCALTAENTELKDYAGKAAGKSYQELSNLNMYGNADRADAAHTVGYYEYMSNDFDHQAYPYPMPQVTVSDASGAKTTQVQTAYGDWSYQTQDHYSLLYYEKVDGSYYFHGVSTADGGTYTAVTSDGANLENGLLAEGGKTVSASGYVLVTGANSAWSTFGRADNTGAVSLPADVNTTKTTGKTEIFKEADAELLNALKSLGSLPKNTADDNPADIAYVFQLDKYLSYSDANTTTSSSSATQNSTDTSQSSTAASSAFAPWQTLTQESEGIGITIYSGKGNIPAARFSFQPFFADTVKGAKSSDGATANEKALQSTFVTTKDGAADHDYRVRSLSQLESISKWDSQKFTSVTGATNLSNAFDKESARRFSYLSTSALSTAENCKNHLKIRQDMDIHLENTSDVSFQYMDGTYFGRKYGNPETAVQLQNLRNKDFAHYVTSTGGIKSLVLESAYYTSTIKTVNGDKDVDHSSNEFVEYNYGTLSDITVQNSTLGSAGLVYQNGDVTKNVLTKTLVSSPKVGEQGTKVAQVKIDGKDVEVRKYEFKYEYSVNGTASTGVVEKCVIKNSTRISGAGLAWRNIGGRITDSGVEECHNIGASGFAEYNESTFVTAPKTQTEYQYWISLSNWTEDRSSYRQVSDALISQNNWATMTSDGELTFAVDAIIDNCHVSGCEWNSTDQPGIGESGFVRINQVNTEGTSASTEAQSSGKAVISNCSVADVGAAVSGFAYENLNGAQITRCQVYGSKGSNKGYSSSSIGSAGIDQSAGFVVTNDSGSVIDSCSFTGQVQGKKIGGFVCTNEGTIRNSYANIHQGWNSTEVNAAGFVLWNENGGQIQYCHALGIFGGSQDKSKQKNCKAAGFVWENKTGASIANSYAAIWATSNPGYNMKEYSLFARTAGGTFTECYAMKPDSGTWTSSNSGIKFVTGETIKNKTDALGDAEKGMTVAYGEKIGDYPFPVKADIPNYGDWYDEWGDTPSSSVQSASEYSVSLTAGAGIFSEESVAAGKALSAGEGSEANAISLAALNEADDLSADVGTTSAGDTETGASVSELVLTLQPEESGEEEAAETELDLSQFTPTRKGWKLLGWLITSPSELANQTEKTVVADIVTKINKVSKEGATDSTSEKGEAISSETGSSDAGASEQAGTGSAEKAEGQTKSAGAVYELEKGSKSYHYAPDAVITVTQDVTLAAVWVPDDDTIAKAKDGTLRMDESGNVLDEEAADANAASKSDGAETAQSSAAQSQDDQTSANKEDGASDAGMSASGDKAADGADAGTSAPDGNASTGADAGASVTGDKAVGGADAGTSEADSKLSGTMDAAGSTDRDVSQTSTDNAANASNSSSSDGTSTVDSIAKAATGTSEEVSDPEIAGTVETADAGATETVVE